MGSPEADKNLYVNILAAEVRSKQSLALYNKFAELASNEQKSTLISTLKAAYNPLFYAQVLTVEKEYDKFFALMSNLHREKDVPPLLKLVAPHLTEKAWEWTKAFANKGLESGKRSCDLYTPLAQCVAAFLPISGYEKKPKPSH